MSSLTHLPSGAVGPRFLSRPVFLAWEVSLPRWLSSPVPRTHSFAYFYVVPASVKCRHSRLLLKDEGWSTGRVVEPFLSTVVVHPFILFRLRFVFDERGTSLAPRGARVSPSPPERGLRRPSSSRTQPAPEVDGSRPERDVEWIPVALLFGISHLNLSLSGFISTKTNLTRTSGIVILIIKLVQDVNTINGRVMY